MVNKEYLYNRREVKHYRFSKNCSGDRSAELPSKSLVVGQWLGRYTP